MKSYIKKKSKLFKHIVNYVFSETAIKGLAFVALPFFSYKLTTDEFGLYSLTGTLFSFLSVLLILGFHGAVNRYRYENNNEDYDQFLVSILLAIIIFNIVMFGIIYVIDESLFHLINVEKSLFIYTMVAAAANATISIYLSHLQAIQNSQRYARIFIVQNIAVIGISVLLLFSMYKNQYLSKIYAQIIVFLILGGICSWNLLKGKKVFIEWKHLKYAVTFGIPLLPHSLSRFILNLSDRLIINKVVGSAETGLYSYAYNIGMIVSIVIVSMNKAWAPAFYEAMKKHDIKKINKIIPQCSIVIYYLACMIILFADYLGKLLAPQDYYSALVIIPVIVVGYVIMFFYNIYINYSMYYKKSGVISGITMCVAIINIILNIIFIPKYGYMIASITTTFSFFLMATFHYIYVRYILQSELTLKIKKLMPTIVWIPITISLYYIINYCEIKSLYQLLSKVIFAIVLTFIYFKEWKKNK